MPFNFLNLDTRTRELMEQELEFDLKENQLHISERLNNNGKINYQHFLREAFKNGNEVNFANLLKTGDYFNKTEKRNYKGRLIDAKIPENAADMLSEGEFNRFYCRALCVRAIEDGTVKLIIYRAKFSRNPRPESVLKEGQEIDPSILLSDLRTNIGVDTVFRIPAGPNSGLSVKIDQP